jgi:hypothetical protein
MEISVNTMAGKKVFPFVSLVDVEPNVNSEFLLID